MAPKVVAGGYDTGSTGDDGSCRQHHLHSAEMRVGFYRHPTITIRGGARGLTRPWELLDAVLGCWTR
ncbi:MAG: hypothetical protein M0005_02095 [Actinomycetota bacterium]|nr:hypothetical protein [Actinomycetota bacterium]